MVRLHRIIGRAVAVASLAAIAGAIIVARPADWPVVAIIIVAMAWGAAPQAIDAFAGKSDPAPAGPPLGDRDPGSFTIVLHVGGQATAISRVGLDAAIATAPAVVVATDPSNVARLGPCPCPVFVAGTVEAALNDAIATIETDAVLIVSSNSFVDTDAASTAAGLIRDGVAWVTGRARTFNRDGFSPLVRGRLGGRLRTSARLAGLQLWEPNATIVATRVLRRQGFEPGRPWGAMLRRLGSQGAIGAELDTTLSMTAQPVDARSYWPSSVLRRRRTVADLADAVATTRGRARAMAFGMLLHELDGSLLAVWLVAPLLLTRTDTLAFRCPVWVLLGLVAVPGLLRWFAWRRIHRIELHPLEDVLAMAFDAPGSMLAVPTVFTRRVRPTRLMLTRQPLLIAALIFASLTTVPLLAGGTTAHRSAAAGMALSELALLWLLVMRVIFQRNWSRTTYRVRARLSTRVRGFRATTLDLSPSGVAVEGALAGLTVGSGVDLDFDLDDGSTLSARGIVEDRRLLHGVEVTGISLRVPPDGQSRWVAQLSRSVAAAATRPNPSRPLETIRPKRAPGPRRWLDGVVIGVIGVVSLSAAAWFCAAAVGYRPMIVRSGSMVPALRVGDVVLVEDVRVEQLAVGDIATIEDRPEVSDTLTHRVEAITPDGDVIDLRTRGDANLDSETFTLARRTIVGRVVARLPGVGRPVAWAGDSWARAVVALAGVAILFVVLGRGSRRSKRRSTYPARDDGSAVTAVVGDPGAAGAGGDVGVRPSGSRQH